MNKENKNLNQKEEQVVSFQKDFQYYFDKGVHFFQIEDYSKSWKFFRKAVETKPESSSPYYKVAYFLSELGKERTSKILEKLPLNEVPEFHYLLGIYYCMEGDLDSSEHHLEEFIKKDPAHSLKAEAEKLLDSIQDAVLFQSNLNFIKLSFKYAGITDSIRERLKIKFESPFVRVKMRESLYQLDDDLIANVIFLYGLLENNERAEKVLRHFIKSPFAKEEHIELALLALKRIGAQEPYDVKWEDKFKKVTMKEYMERNKEMDHYSNIWSEVLQYTHENMKESGKYSDKSFKEIKTLWTKFIKAVYPDVPHIENKMNWAAGLEYTFLKRKSINVSRKHIALIYRVPDSAVLDKYKYIKEALESKKN